jgi:thiamine-phosphate pyrophosphorylase
MAKDRAVTSGGTGRPRLVLITPVVADAAAFAPELSSASSAGDVAAVILRLAPADDETQIKRVREVAAALTSSGPILMLDGHANIVTRTPADGVHLNGSAMVSAARGALREERTIGAGGLHSRHDAMTAAESGADYVLFGEPDAGGRRPGLPALVERVEWWAELFVIPCVAYVVNLDEIDDLVTAGADFIALGEEAVWNSPQGAARALATAMVHLAVAEPAE